MQPFVADISGHTFYLVAQLEKYMKNYKGSKKNLNNDINAFIKAFIATYIKNGFHNLHEILSVFEARDRNNRLFINDIFQKYGVTLDLNFSDKVLEHAMNDSLQYVKLTSFKSLMHDEFKNKKLLSEQNKLYNDKSSIPNDNNDNNDNTIIKV